MKISGISNLDIGMSNIEIEGEVTYTLTPRHIEGDNKDGHYSFYGQFVVIKDETGKMGCNINFKNEEYKLEKGMMARVKGRLEEYKNKKGEMQKTLKGSLMDISKEDKTTDVQLEQAKEYFDDKAKEEKQTKTAKENIPNSVWEEKDLRIARECAVKAVTELVCAKIMENKDFFSFANTIVKYIYNGLPENSGLNENPKADKIEKARQIVKEHGKLEVKNEDVPFPDETGPKSKTKVKEKTKEKSAKTTKDLERLFHDGQEIGLSTWVELIGFAVKKDIFEVGTSVEDARVKLLANDKGCYDSLTDFIDIRENVGNLPDDEQPTADIPF